MLRKLIFLTSFLLVVGLAGDAVAQMDIDPAAVETGHVYLLEDVNDGTVSDDSANDNAGVIVGDPQLVDGLNGKALQFDGIDDGVHVPDSEFINVTGGPFANRTVIAVFNCADVTKQEKQTVFEEGGLTRGLTIYVFDGQVYVGGWNKAEYQWNPGSWISAPIESNQWYTVSMVIRNGADAQEGDKFEMWLDGNFVGIAPGGQLYNHGNDNAIGYTLQNNVFHDGDASDDGWYFEGMIDEVWILNEALEIGTIPIAVYPAPADGEVDVKSAPALTWTAPDTAFQHDLYLGTDMALVAAGDASVFQGSLTEPSFAVDVNEPLGRGITYYWKVDVLTGSARASELNPGNVWSFRVADENTESWLAAARKDSPGYLDTFVEDGLYDIGQFSGDMTYEFVVISNPDEQEASMALIARREFGDTQVGLKYEQWNNTGTYGATVFGVVDLDFGVANDPGQYTHLAFVSSEDAGTTTLYVNGVEQTSVDSAITLSGLVGIGHGVQGEDMSGSFDNFDGTIFGAAIYDTALTAEQIAAHSDAYFNPVTEIIPVAPGTEGLVAYYPFENDVNDASGNGNDGTIVGDPNFVDGPMGFGTAMEFNGDDYIDCGNADSLQIQDEITMAFWFNVAAFENTWEAMLSKGDTAYRVSRGPGDGDATHMGISGTTAGDGNGWFNGNSLVTGGIWHHFAGTYDGTEGRIYIDGVLDATTEATGQINIETENLWIGNNSQNIDRFFHGMMDEVMLYNRALSEAEVMYLAGRRATPADPGADDLLAFFPLENDVLDASGNGNDGTIVGDPNFVEGPAGFGMAMEFDGDDYVDTGNVDDLAEWSIACWAKSPAAPSGDPPSGPVHREQNYQFNWNHSSEVFRASVTVNAGGWHAASLGNLQADTWYHLAGSYDGETLKSYLDGELITANEEPSGPPVAETNSLKLAKHAAADQFFTGTVDEAAVYTRALSAGEIRYIAGFRVMEDLFGPDITGPNDLIQGVPNDGLQDGSGNFGWPENEHPALAIDDDVTTKYLHFKGEAEPTGVRIELAAEPVIVVGLTLTTANDAPERDPVSFEFYGSNDSIDGPYEMIAGGDIVDFAGDDEWPRFTMNATPIMINSNVAYKYYQVMFPTVRDPASANSMQIAEIELRVSKY
jgi:hypothetical protein